ncbi:MAG: hypothetical protein ACXWQO_02380 [Bdellovibrionota bacterium]
MKKLIILALLVSFSPMAHAGPTLADRHNYEKSDWDQLAKSVREGTPITLGGMGLNQPAVEPEQKSNWDGYANVVKEATPLALGGMGLYQPNISVDNDE